MRQLPVNQRQAVFITRVPWFGLIGTLAASTVPVQPAHPSHVAPTSAVSLADDTRATLPAHAVHHPTQTANLWRLATLGWLWPAHDSAGRASHVVLGHVARERTN